MRKVIALVLALYLPLFGAVYELRGKYEKSVVIPKATPDEGVSVMSGKVGGGLTPTPACGIAANLSFFYGLKQNLEGLQEFLTNWANSATAVLLYALATSLPVAKEALLGANTLSSFMANLRGFNCSRVMEAIKEWNYTDSVLVKACIRRKLGLKDLADVDEFKNKSPSEWWNAYKECLSSASIWDLLGGETQGYLSFVSPKQWAKCFLKVKDSYGYEDVMNADLTTKAKYFLYWILPDLKASADGIVRIETKKIKDPVTGEERNADVLTLLETYKESFREDYEKLIEELKEADLSNEDEIKEKLREFGKKYGLDLEELDMLVEVTVRLYKELEELYEGGKLPPDQVDRYYELKMMIEKDLKDFLAKEALERLKAELNKQALKLTQGFRTASLTGGKNECNSF